MIIKQYITDFLWECTAFFGVLQVVLNYKDVKVPKRLTGIAAMLTIDSSKEQTQSYSIPRQKISWPIHFPQFRHAASKPTPVDASTGLMPQFPLRVCLRKLLCLMIFVSSFLPSLYSLWRYPLSFGGFLSPCSPRGFSLLQGHVGRTSLLSWLPSYAVMKAFWLTYLQQISNERVVVAVFWTEGVGRLEFVLGSFPFMSKVWGCSWGRGRPFVDLLLCCCWQGLMLETAEDSPTPKGNWSPVPRTEFLLAAGFRLEVLDFFCVCVWQLDYLLPIPSVPSWDYSGFCQKIKNALCLAIGFICWFTPINKNSAGVKKHCL